MGRLRKYSNSMKACKICGLSCSYEDADKHFVRNGTNLRRYCKKKECAKAYHKAAYAQFVGKKIPNEAKLKRINEIRVCFQMWQVVGGEFRR